MARQRSGKDPDLVEDELDEVDLDEDADDEDEDRDSSDSSRSAQIDAMWSDVGIEPVEIALPKGVGFTLRAYRPAGTIRPTEVEEEDDDFSILDNRADDVDDEDMLLDDEEELFVEEDDSRPGRGKRARAHDDDDDSDEDEDDESEDDDFAEPTEEDWKTAEAELSDDDESDRASRDDDGDSDDESEDDAEDDSDDDDDVRGEDSEEVPAFLTHRGQLLMFRSPEGLVEFVQSDEEHDLRQLPEWESLQRRITVAAIAPKDDDRYELDLVVSNLRGDHETWDEDLLIAAGEVARDLAYALRLAPVNTALSSGSPIDDLDEALRAKSAGGIGGFFGRRKLKKIGSQQASLGWRTIIGKISAAVDWRD